MVHAWGPSTWEASDLKNFQNKDNLDKTLLIHKFHCACVYRFLYGEGRCLYVLVGVFVGLVGGQQSKLGIFLIVPI